MDKIGVTSHYLGQKKTLIRSTSVLLQMRIDTAREEDGDAGQSQRLGALLGIEVHPLFCEREWCSKTREKDAVL